MSEVNNVIENGAVEALNSSEELSLEKVDTLVKKGMEEIQKGAYDKAIEILVQLDRGRCMGKPTNNDKNKLIQALWEKNFREGKKLLEMTFETFRVTCQDMWVCVIPADNSFPYMFSYSVSTSREGKEALSNAFKAYKKGNFSLFESKIPEILALYTNEEISNIHLAKLIGKICRKNIVEAHRLSPLFAAHAKMTLEERTLKIEVGTFTLTFSSDKFLFIDAEKGVQIISKEEDAEDKIRMYIRLAEFHPSRALEILALAESELPNLGSPMERLDAIDYLADAYMKHQAAKQYNALTSLYDLAIEELKASVDADGIVTRFILQAGTNLIEKKQAEYEKNIKSAKEALSQVKNNECFTRTFEKKLENLAEKADEVFGIDQLELHARKV